MYDENEITKSTSGENLKVTGFEIPALKALAGLAGVAISLYQKGGTADGFDSSKAYEAVLGQAVGGVFYDLFKSGGTATLEKLKSITRNNSLSTDNLNHDLQKAARKAQLIATFFACQHCLQKLKNISTAKKSKFKKLVDNGKELITRKSDEEGFFTELITYLDNQMRDEVIKNVVYEGTLSVEQFEAVFKRYDQAVSSDSHANISKILKEDILNEIELTGTVGRLFEFNQTGFDLLKTTVENGWDEIPLENFEKKLFVSLDIFEKRQKKFARYDWFDLVCAFFNEEYKNNPRVEAAANKQLLFHISTKLDTFGTLNTEVSALVTQISHFTQKLDTILAKVDEIKEEQSESKKREEAMLAKADETIGILKTIAPFKSKADSQTFVALPNLTEKIYGRSREIGDIIGHLRTERRHGAIVAPTCFGKTCLIKKFLYQTLDDGKVKDDFSVLFEKVIYLDCRGNSTFENIVRHFATLMGAELKYKTGDEVNFLKLNVFGKLQTEKILLIFDNFEEWISDEDVYINGEAAIFLNTFLNAANHNIHALFVSQFLPQKEANFSARTTILKPVTDNLLDGLDEKSALELVRKESAEACLDRTETDLDTIGDDKLTAFLEEVNYIPQAIMSMIYFIAGKNISFFEFRTKYSAAYKEAENDDTNIEDKRDAKLRPTRVLLKLQIAALNDDARHLLSLLAFFGSEVPREVLTMDFSKEISYEIGFESEKLRVTLNYLNNIHLIRSEIDEARETDVATGEIKKIVYYRLHSFIGEVVRESDKFEIKHETALENFSANLGYKMISAWTKKLYRKQSSLNECRKRIGYHLIDNLGKTEHKFDLAWTLVSDGLILTAKYELSKKKEDFDAAIEKFNKAIELDSDYADAYYDLGILLAKDEHRKEEAEDKYNEAIMLNPNDASYYNNLGNLLAKDERRKVEAEEKYNKAIELDSDDASYYINLGALLAEDKNRLAEAEVKFNNAIELNPNYADAYNNLGNLLDKAGRIKEAEEKYNKAIELNPNYSQAYNNLGALLAEDKNRLAEAEVKYNEAIRLNPNYSQAYYNLGIFLDKAGRLEEAEEKFNKAIELNPNYSQAYNNLGNLLAKDERRKVEAEEKYNKAIELNPNYADAYNNLAALLAKDEHRRDEAEEKYNKAIELNPSDAQVYNNLGVFLDVAGRVEEAEEKFNKAIELDPNYPQPYYNFGILLNNAGKIKEAEEKFKKAIDLNPNYIDAYYNLGVLLANDERRRDDAEEKYNKAIELNPNYSLAYYGLGVLFYDSEKYKKAEVKFVKFLEWNPNMFGACYYLARINSLTGNKEKALDYLKRAADLNSNMKSYAKEDSAFDSIRDDERFRDIVSWVTDIDYLLTKMKGLKVNNSFKETKE